MLTALIGVIAGTVAAWFVYPHVYDWMLIRDLGSEDVAVRDRALGRATMAAKRTPRTRAALNAALDTDDDLRFAGIVAVLRRTNHWDTQPRDAELMDRYRAIEFDLAGVPAVRHSFVFETLAAGRDNKFIRRLLKACGADPAPRVRTTAALLAGQLGDSDALGRLLADDDPKVVASAALSAGFAGRTALAGAVRTVMTKASDPHVRTSARYALGLLDEDEASLAGAVRTYLAAHPPASPTSQPTSRPATQPATRPAGTSEPPPPPDELGRLMHLAGLAHDKTAAEAVKLVLTAYRERGLLPPAMALRAAGRLKLTDARADVERTLSAPGRQPPPLEGQLLAALQAGPALGMDVRPAAEQICRRAWCPEFPFVLMEAARALGRTPARAATAPAEDPARTRRERLLQQCTMYAVAYDTKPGQPQRIVTTPMASAAAAVALWELDAPASKHFVAYAASTGFAPSQYVAWHVAHLRPDDARELGFEMLPPLAPPQPVDTRPAYKNPPPTDPYSDNERAAGAMLLALTCRTDARRQRAIARIQSRLKGGAAGGEDSFHVAATYRCALVTLGRTDLADQIAAYLSIGEFPRSKVIPALCAVGRRDGLDWLLVNPQITPDLLSLLYLNKGLGPWLAGAVGALPRLDACAGEDVRRWQGQILQACYAVRRNRISLGKP